MATKERMWVQTWKVLVNNSGQSNMTNVVGRYLTKEAAEAVAKAFRDALYADPYNYRTDCRLNRTNDGMDVTTVADMAVKVEADGFNNVMTEPAIRLAQQNGVTVRDEQGRPISLDA